MSAPSHYAKEAEQIKYSLLAAKAKESISKLLGDEQLSEEDKHCLTKAANFLKSVADGAQLVSSGHYSGHNSREAMQHLQIAIDPIKHLEKINENQEISSYISELANALSLAISDSKKLKEEGAKRDVKSASDFFNAMFDHLLLAITENQRSGQTLFEPRNKYA